MVVLGLNRITSACTTRDSAAVVSCASCLPPPVYVGVVRCPCLNFGHQIQPEGHPDSYLEGHTVQGLLLRCYAGHWMGDKDRIHFQRGRRMQRPFPPLSRPLPGCESFISPVPQEIITDGDIGNTKAISVQERPQRHQIRQRDWAASTNGVSSVLGTRAAMVRCAVLTQD